jgi:glycogen operon protein
VLAIRLVIFADLLGLPCCNVNFLAAHAGVTLADTVATPSATIRRMATAATAMVQSQAKQRRGGAERLRSVITARARDLLALLDTLFASVGSIMLALSDEIGRTQGDNNNTYAQDNRLVWLDWEGRNLDLKAHVASSASTPANSEQAVLIADASRAPRCLRVRRATRR